MNQSSNEPLAYEAPRLHQASDIQQVSQPPLVPESVCTKNLCTRVKANGSTKPLKQLPLLDPLLIADSCALIVRI